MSKILVLLLVLACEFIHSFRLFLLRPFKSSTTQRRSRLQHGYCIGVSRQSAQATVGKGLAQGPYVTARAEIEPTTLRLKVIDSTKAPSRLICHFLYHLSSCTYSPTICLGPGQKFDKNLPHNSQGGSIVVISLREVCATAPV